MGKSNNECVFDRQIAIGQAGICLICHNINS